jgi:hypothetical protein
MKQGRLSPSIVVTPALYFHPSRALHCTKLVSSPITWSHCNPHAFTMAYSERIYKAWMRFRTLRRNVRVIKLCSPLRLPSFVSSGLCSSLTPLQSDNMGRCRQFVYMCFTSRRHITGRYRAENNELCRKLFQKNSCTMKFVWNFVHIKVFLFFVPFIFKEGNRILRGKLESVFRCITDLLRFSKSLFYKRLLWENVFLYNLALVNIRELSISLSLQRRVQLSCFRCRRKLHIWAQLPYWTLLHIIYVNNVVDEYWIFIGSLRNKFRNIRLCSLAVFCPRLSI